MVGRYVEGGRLDCVFGEGVTEREVSRVLVSLDLKASVVHMLISFRIGRFLTKRLAYRPVDCESVHDNQNCSLCQNHVNAPDFRDNHTQTSYSVHSPFPTAVTRTHDVVAALAWGFRRQ